MVAFLRCPVRLLAINVFGVEGGRHAPLRGFSPQADWSVEVHARSRAHVRASFFPPSVNILFCLVWIAGHKDRVFNVMLLYVVARHLEHMQNARTVTSLEVTFTQLRHLNTNRLSCIFGLGSSTSTAT